MNAHIGRTFIKFGSTMIQVNRERMKIIVNYLKMRREFKQMNHEKDAIYIEHTKSRPISLS